MRPYVLLLTLTLLGCTEILDEPNLSARRSRLSAAADPDKRVEICHNGKTITVAAPAITAHRAHGDELGACNSGCSNDNACDDGDACTFDVCGAGGECQHSAVTCDDGNVCTNDVCDPAVGCVATPADGAACDDGNDCSANDSCLAGQCGGLVIPGCCVKDADCLDSDACTTDTCRSGSCSSEPLACDVTNVCLAGFCDPLSGDCATTPVTDGTPCNDGDPATVGDSCHDGTCRGGYATATSLTAPNGTSYCGSLTLVASVSASQGVPQGTVTFADGGTPLGSSSLAAAQASFVVDDSSFGSHSFTALYGGAGDHLQSESAPVVATHAPSTITFETPVSDACGTPSGAFTFATPVSTEFLPMNIDVVDIGGSNPLIYRQPAQPAVSDPAFDPNDNYSLTTGIFFGDVGVMRIELATPPTIVRFRVRHNAAFNVPIVAVDSFGNPITTITYAPDPATLGDGLYLGEVGVFFASRIVTITSPLGVAAVDVSPLEGENTRLVAIDNLSQVF